MGSLSKLTATTYCTERVRDKIILATKYFQYEFHHGRFDVGSGANTC